MMGSLIEPPTATNNSSETIAAARGRQAIQPSS